MGAGPHDSSSTKPAWLCFFLLGAGILAPWNAFITATDYFTAMFPGAHVDRLFTVSYLPSCLLLLVICVVGGERCDRWLGAARTRISVCYVAFTLVLLMVPLVDALGASWRQQLGPPVGALPLLMLTVVGVGALDGGCQGAVFSDAARHGATYTQAVAAGTACSGLLVSVLRCACKAAWLASDTPPTSALRASTALYFGLGALLTAACWLVHGMVLPRLLATQHAQGQHQWDMHLPSKAGQVAGDPSDPSECRDTELVGLAMLGGNGECEEGARAGAPGRREGAGLAANVEHTPLLAQGVRQGTHKLPPAPPGPPHERDDSQVECDDDADDVVALESLLGSRQEGSAHRRSPKHGNRWQEEAAQQLLQLHQWQGQQEAPAGQQHMPAGAVHGPGDHMAKLRVAWPVLKPYCVSLFITYCVTLSIFPGFLAEDVHSAELGEWYALIVITMFNASDMAGKLMAPAPPRLAATHGLPTSSSNEYATRSGGRNCHARVLRVWQHACTGLLRSPVWLASVRGGVLLAVFLCAAAFEAPPWFILTATVALGLSNGWLTVVAMASGPSLLPAPLAEVGEGLLVVSLVAGLLAGALMGWLWLLPGHVA